MKQRLGSSLAIFAVAVIALIFAPSSDAAGVFGDGIDGDVVISSSTHLTSDKEYNNLTVNAGVILYTNGFTVRVANTLLNNGFITDTASGGNGGNNGVGGLGGRFSSGHIPPQSGSSGANGGSPSIAGAGSGGRGGSGGGGGGAAWETFSGHYANGGTGGNGGDGGVGGGFVEIYANIFQNNGTIHANGGPGQNGFFATQGQYEAWTVILVADFDLAGGGGGGGAGGSGGNGGSVYIYYGSIAASGTITANGGSAGIGRPGASGRNTNHGGGISGTNEENGASGGGSFPAGGGGGRGEFSSAQSGTGGTGQTGSVGTSGTTSLVAATTCYVDNDSDGYGDAADPGTPVIGACGAGFSTNNGDCDDGNSSVNPGATEVVADAIDQDCNGGDVCYADNDSDGFGSNSTVLSLDLDCNDAGESPNNFDCNDANASIYPGASEIVADGIDEDCDGAEVCYQDNDGDGFGSNATLLSLDLDCLDAGESGNNLDCNDGNASINPTETEIVADGIDQNCDGQEVCYLDNDGDGYGSPATVISADIDCFDAGESDNSIDCDDGNVNIYPGAPEIVADGIDQDCNGSEACYLDNDLDGFGSLIVFASVDLDCFDPGESMENTDCDDSDSGIYPGAPEIGGNGIDEDCDGMDASCCFDVRGNVDNVPFPDVAGFGGIDIADLVYFVDYSFSGGPAPACIEEADVDNSSTLDIADIVYLVSYMFTSGPAPLNCI